MWQAETAFREKAYDRAASFYAKVGPTGVPLLHPRLFVFRVSKPSGISAWIWLQTSGIASFEDVALKFVGVGEQVSFHPYLPASSGEESRFRIYASIF